MFLTLFASDSHHRRMFFFKVVQKKRKKKLEKMERKTLNRSKVLWTYNINEYILQFYSGSSPDGYSSESSDDIDSLKERNKCCRFDATSHPYLTIFIVFLAFMVDAMLVTVVGMNLDY